ncbi:MAG: LamG domain-containing protein, partial [Candidatus Pacearchaeota archaeon]
MNKLIIKIKEHKRIFLGLSIILIILLLLILGNLTYSSQHQKTTGRVTEEILSKTELSEASSIAEQIALGEKVGNIDMETVDLDIKEPIFNNKIMEFNTPDGKINLEFDLLNYSEWIENNNEDKENAEDFDIIINQSKEKYKWRYNVQLKDLHFMARIDVSADDIVVIDNQTLKIGNYYLSFSDLTNQGYVVRVESPVLLSKVNLSEINVSTTNINITEINETETNNSEINISELNQTISNGNIINISEFILNETQTNETIINNSITNEDEDTDTNETFESNETTSNEKILNETENLDLNQSPQASKNETVIFVEVNITSPEPAETELITDESALGSIGEIEEIALPEVTEPLPEPPTTEEKITKFLETSGELSSESITGNIIKTITGFVTKGIRGITGFFIHGWRGLTGLVISNNEQTISVYIQKDFANSSVQVGDTINLDPILIGIMSGEYPPSIEFIGDTPEDGTNVSGLTIPVSISVSDNNLTYGFIDFSNTLVLWIRGENNDATDESIYSNNGSLVGVSMTDSGRFGKGFEFNTSDNYITISNSSTIQTNSENLEGRTISGWINPRNNTRSLILAQTGKDQYGNIFGYHLFLNNESNLCFDRKYYNALLSGSYSETLDGLCSSTSLNNNEWTHFTIKFYGVGGWMSFFHIDLYINGQLNVGNSFYGNIEEANYNLSFGNSTDPQYDLNLSSFNGTMDEILIFNKVLSANEIEGLYNLPSSFSNNYTSIDLDTDLAYWNYYNFTGYVVDEDANKNNTETREVYLTDSTAVQGCRELSTSNTQYTLMNNITELHYYHNYSEGEIVFMENTGCLYIEGDNITLDCNNYYIINSTFLTNGILALGNNITIKNCNILINERDMDQIGGITIGRAIWSQDTSNCLLENIHLYNSTLYVIGAFNSTIKDSRLDRGLFLEASKNITCLNCTYNLEYETVSDWAYPYNYETQTYSLSSPVLLRKWYYRAQVTDNQSTPIQGAKVQMYNSTGGIALNLTTNNIDGETGIGEVLDYINYGMDENDDTHPQLRLYQGLQGVATKVDEISKLKDEHRWNATEKQNNLTDLFVVNEDWTNPVTSSSASVAISNSTGSYATIAWNTDELANSSVEYWGSHGINGQSGYVTGHSVELTDLISNHSYIYQYTSCDFVHNCVASENQTFKTPEIGQASVSGGSSQCISYWDCSDWSLCSGNIQTRICTDLNKCIIPSSISPPTSQSCTSLGVPTSTTETPLGSGSSGRLFGKCTPEW